MEKVTALAFLYFPGGQVQPCPDMILLLNQRMGEAGGLLPLQSPPEANLPSLFLSSLLQVSQQPPIHPTPCHPQHLKCGPLEERG